MSKIGLKQKTKWNDLMYGKHPTPYDHPIAGLIERYRVSTIKNLAQIKPTDTVLEIGCEGGNLLSLLPPAKKLVGLDISKAALTQAKKKLGNKAELVHADAEEIINLGKREFDVIICSQTLEHVKYPERIMENIKRLANIDTRIVISVPNEKFILQVKKFLKSISLMKVFMKGIEDHTSEWHIQVFDNNLVKKIVKNNFDIYKSLKVLNIYLIYLLRKKVSV